MQPTLCSHVSREQHERVFYCYKRFDRIHSMCTCQCQVCPLAFPEILRHALCALLSTDTLWKDNAWRLRAMVINQRFCVHRLPSMWATCFLRVYRSLAFCCVYDRMLFLAPTLHLLQPTTELWGAKQWIIMFMYDPACVFCSIFSSTTHPQTYHDEFASFRVCISSATEDIHLRSQIACVSWHVYVDLPNVCGDTECVLHSANYLWKKQERMQS